MSDPRIWAQDLWNSMHRIAIAYPEKPTEEDKELARGFFKGIALNPCPGCQMHYRKAFKETFNDEVLKSSDTLQRWVYDLHETVNKRLGIASTIKFEDVPKIVNKFPTRFVDLDTGKILSRARYINDGGVSCPHEARAREWLEANRGKSLDDRMIWEKVFDPLSDKEQLISKLIFIALAIISILLFVVLPMHTYYNNKLQEQKQQQTETSSIKNE